MQTESNQFAKAIKTLAQTVCQIIVDVKEKKKTPHVGLLELEAFIVRFNDMMNDNSYRDKAIIQSLLDLCTEAKDCLSKDLN